MRKYTLFLSKNPIYTKQVTLPLRLSEKPMDISALIEAANSKETCRLTPVIYEFTL